MPVAPLIGLAGSIGGALLGRGGSSSTQTGSSSSRPYYTDTQMGLQGNVGKLIRQLLKGKETALDRQQKTAMGEDVNSGSDAVMANMQSRMAGSGFGGSGKEGMNTLALQLNRNQNQLRGSLELDKAKSARQMQALGIGSQVAFNPSGSDNTSTSTGTQSGQSIGQSLAPVVAGAGQDLSAWLQSRGDK